ncbi:hypothetical protein BH20ACI4_BH20ACI4_00860 [soil metagenome]
MKNESPKNSDCKFAPEIVEYLYDEIGGERKNSFELHLNNCSECADEIEDFSGLRFSIQDWKAAEFDKIATPAIQIPYQVVKTVETEKVSWFDAVRRYFSLSPVLSGAMAVLLIALFFALGIFVLSNNDESNLIAVSNQKPNLNAKPSEQPQPSVVTKKDETIKTPEIVETDVEVIDEKPLGINPPTEVPAQVNNRSNPKQKIQPVKTVEKKTPNTDLKNDTKNAKNIPTKNKPRLNELPEEVEDNSLRLADLFAELETKE